MLRSTFWGPTIVSIAITQCFTRVGIFALIIVKRGRVGMTDGSDPIIECEFAASNCTIRLKG